MTVNTTKGLSINHATKPLVKLALTVRWLIHGTGMLSSNLAEAAAFMRSHDDPTMIHKVSDLTSAPQEPDVEFVSLPASYGKVDKAPPPDPNSHQWTIFQIPLRPSSVGTITLASRNPFTPPVIHANYFSTSSDRHLSIWAFRRSCAIAQGSGAFVGWAIPSRADELSDEEVLEYLRRRANTCFHPTGTAKIGAEEEGGVVDCGGLRVHGVRGLRVCDVSVMPRILSGHPCAPIIAIAEKFADMLKVEYAQVKL